MADGNQLSFGDGLLSNRRTISKLSKHLQKPDLIIDWQTLVREISIIDRTVANTGGRTRKNPLWMIKASFLPSQFRLSDPRLEDQLIDRLSFQRFVGINMNQEIPDFTTFWRLNEVLSTHNLEEHIFELIGEQLEEEPSSQIDTDTNTIRKGGTYYFGYKGNIGVDIESKLIRKVTFTLASAHDSTKTEQLVIYDEKTLFGDKVYVDSHRKYSARHYGWYYGVLVKATRSQLLSGSQKKRNRKLNSVRAVVEDPFAWMSLDLDASGKTKAGLVAIRAKNETRDWLRFIFACIGWNLSRAGFLLEKSRSVGSVAL